MLGCPLTQALGAFKGQVTSPFEISLMSWRFP